MRSTTSLRQRALTDTFNETRLLIYRISHDMAFRFRIPFEDVYGQAVIIFVKAYEAFRPDRGAKFTTWLHMRLQNRLINWLKKEYPHWHHAELDLNLATSPVEAHRDWLSLADHFSPRTRRIVELLVKDNPELLAVQRWNETRARKRKATPHSIIANMCEYFESAGFTFMEVQNAFDEIREVLSGERRGQRGRQVWLAVIRKPSFMTGADVDRLRALGLGHLHRDDIYFLATLGTTRKGARIQLEVEE